MRLNCEKFKPDLRLHNCFSVFSCNETFAGIIASNYHILRFHQDMASSTHPDAKKDSLELMPDGQAFPLGGDDDEDEVDVKPVMLEGPAAVAPANPQQKRGAGPRSTRNPGSGIPGGYGGGGDSFEDEDEDEGDGDWNSAAGAKYVLFKFSTVVTAFALVVEPLLEK